MTSRERRSRTPEIFSIEPTIRRYKKVLRLSGGKIFPKSRTKDFFSGAKWGRLNAADRVDRRHVAVSAFDRIRPLRLHFFVGYFSTEAGCIFRPTACLYRSRLSRW
ncbi:MAG TPA: hypothetical protein DEB39_16645 [Planctomycetaceae bacterium]|nr:hypothetical protein [Planctomycetaceae bacterium]